MVELAYFPILNDPVIRAIPWEAIHPHEAQAQKNHYQSLKRLAQRGGLSVVEATVVILDRPLPRRVRSEQIPEYRHILMRLLRDFAIARAALKETEHG